MDKLSACIELGANAGSNRHEGSFVEPAQAFSPNGIDVILDPLVALTWLTISTFSLGGRLVLWSDGGAQTESIWR